MASTWQHDWSLHRKGHIITSDGKRRIYRFRFDPNQGERVGRGDGDSQVGDVSGQTNPGRGKQAGDYYEAEVYPALRHWFNRGGVVLG